MCGNTYVHTKEWGTLDFQRKGEVENFLKWTASSEKGRERLINKTTEPLLLQTVLCWSASCIHNETMRATPLFFSL